MALADPTIGDHPVDVDEPEELSTPVSDVGRVDLDSLDDDFARLMVFSRAGIGKTTLLGTGAEDARVWPMLYIDVDRSTQAIKSKLNVVDMGAGLRKHKSIPGKIDVVRYTRWKDLENCYDFLYSEPDRFKSVAIDSFSELHQKCLKYVAGHEGRASLRNAQKLEIQHYGEATDLMKTLMRALRDIDMHVFYTAQPKVMEDSDGVLGEITPAFVGNLVWEALSLLPAVGYLRLNGEKRVLDFTPTAKLTTKDRTEGGKLAQRFTNPTIPVLLDAMGIRNN